MTAPAADAGYERLRRRLLVRAGAVAAASTAVGVVAMVTFLGGYRVRGLGLAPVTSLPAPTPVTGCTGADLSGPAVTAMPLPEVVTSPLQIRPGPDAEQLLPPRGVPRVTAGGAWREMFRRGFDLPHRAGTVAVLLGDLSAATPVVEGPDHRARPLFAGTLVWAIYGLHQPLAPAAGMTSGQPCYFESTVFYVDATTGRSLAAEVFAPDQPPTVAS